MNKIRIGAWYPVDLNYLDRHHIKEIADSGINLIFAGWGDAVQKKKILELCGDAGIDVFLSDKNISAGAADPSRYKISAAGYAGEKAFAGTMFADEPHAGLYPEIAQRVNAYSEAFPDKIPFINLFPIYAPLSALGTGSYEEYVGKFAETIPVDYISVDVYPFSRRADGIKRTLETYFRNLDIVASACRRHNREFWCFIQTMGFNVIMRPPTEAEMRFQVYACLSFGATGIFHFCYATPPSGAEKFDYAMIDKNGEKTDLWYNAKAVNCELNGLSEVFLKYKNIGTYLHRAGEPSEGVDFDNQYNISEFDPVSLIESDETLLIGLFKNDNGSAITLLNASEVRREVSATVKLKLNCNKITIYRRGVPESVTSENGIYTIKLEPCDGVFITID